MYYILNETNQTIAADDNLLDLCGVSDVNELSSKLSFGDVKFDLSEENISIHIDNSNRIFSVSKTSLSSTLGKLVLVNIAKEEEDDLSALLLDDMTEGLTTLDINEDKGKALDEMLVEDTLSLVDDDLMGIKEEVNEATETFDLDISIQEDDLFGTAPAVSDDTEILIDIESISQQIGISHEDYDTFLNEYIDTSINLEEDLQSADTEKRSNAIETLSHLGEILHLPVIQEVIADLSSASADTQKAKVGSFYSTLSRLTTQKSSQKESPMELLDSVMPTEVPKPAVNENSFGTISLEGIKPIHFDFQLEEAANDLSLPVELIEEFVNDFIDQAHIETKKMLEAYEKGDLDAIQKIGHLLKGASSNLRINALSDTLYQIQFCEDSSQLEAFIKDYWGHFLSFEIQINAISH